ncbi:MAG TPA: hypothetical protein VGA18_02730, partial [Rhodothermales bacterium]
MNYDARRHAVPRRARKEAGRRFGGDGGPHVSGHPTAPLAYLITFTTYGTWLHGDERGSVDPGHSIPGTPPLERDAHREA